MEIVSINKVDMLEHDKDCACEVFAIHVKIKDIEARAAEMIVSIRDTSWIEGLNAVEKITFEARSKRTIERLAEQIFSKVNDTVTVEFGEYLISDTAQSVLSQKCNHKQVPIAELLKEKISGNPGFDFHTESSLSHIAFGEAKYSGNSNPYKNALKQIGEFISLEKDSAELAILQNFVSSVAIKNYLEGRKAYVAAFSINTHNPPSILLNALKSKHLDALLIHRELYLIGVEIDDQVNN